MARIGPRRHSAERGAAAVEAVVVVCTLAVMLACCWAAFAFQNAKVSVLDDVRTELWPTALEPCTGQEGTLDAIEHEAAAANATLPSLSGSTGDYLDVRATSLARDSGYTERSRSRQVKLPDLVSQSPAKLHGRLFVRCAEPRADERLTDFFKTGFGVARWKFGF